MKHIKNDALNPNPVFFFLFSSHDRKEEPAVMSSSISPNKKKKNNNKCRPETCQAGVNNVLMESTTQTT